MLVSRKIKKCLPFLISAIPVGLNLGRNWLSFILKLYHLFYYALIISPAIRVAK